VPSSFFEPLGPARYRATEATAGPWNPKAQHGGPPSALAARELERAGPAGNSRLARVSVDILGPVPVGELTARTQVLRPGRRVTLLETVLAADGRDVLVARGWRIATSGAAPAVPVGGPAPDLPAQASPPRFPGGYLDGYLAQIEWRFVSGTFEEPGPCRVWARPRLPLLPGEELSPFCRALLVADSGNGVSMALDPRHYQFMNVDLTVVLHRDLAGEFVLLDAQSAIGPDGTGLAQTQLWDAAGQAGTAMQTLLVAPR
jgi:hypothetical protein